MKGMLSCLAGMCLLCSCASAPPYAAYQYDNGDDPVREGLYRIVDGQGRIGYADERGRVVIAPRFAFGFPFAQGRARVTDSGRKATVPGSGGEYHRWESNDWYYIDRTGKRADAPPPPRRQPQAE